MSASVVGRYSWSMNRTREGGREYTLVTRVLSDYDDGPDCVHRASGLPRPGSYWNYGNDRDVWAFCTSDMTITPEYEGEKGRYWKVEQKFATPSGGEKRKRCNDTTVEDPLLEPPKISGSFNSYQKEALKDRFGSPIWSSSREQIKGIMKDETRPTVIIEWNSAVLNLAWMTSAVNTLNDRPMWGVTARKIKLNSINWSRLVYGTCNYYYTKRLEFEVRFNGWDYDTEEDWIMDTGYRCLRGIWHPPTREDASTGTSGLYWTWEEAANVDRYNEGDYIRVKDPFEDPNPMRVPLDGFGGRLTDNQNPVYITDGFEIYGETNFLAYGIPATLG